MGWEEGTVGFFCRRWWGWRGGGKGYLRAIGTTGHRSAHTHAHAPHTHTPPGVLLYREDAGRPGSLSVTRESGEPTAVVWT